MRTLLLLAARRLFGRHRMKFRGCSDPRCDDCKPYRRPLDA